MDFGVAHLAMDHRNSYRHLLGIGDQPSPENTRRAQEIKSVVFDGFADAVGSLGTSGLAVLVDEEYGAPLAARARELGVLVCAPVERSGRAELELEYAEALPRLVDTLKPDLLKVLLRYNVQGDRELNARQAATLSELSSWCLRQSLVLMAEVLVPPTPKQRIDFEDSPAGWEQGLRPTLMVTAIEELRRAGADPAMWKVEGLDTSSAAEAIVAAARAGNQVDARPEVSCLVLGRGESLDRVEDWLRVGASVDGFCGFAVGRSLWNDEAREMFTGTITPKVAIERMSGKYQRLVDAWRSTHANP